MIASARSSPSSADQLVQHQPVEIGAVAEGGVELAAEFLGAFGIVAHAAAFPVNKSWHGGDQRLARRRLRRGDHAAAVPVSTMRPRSMMAMRSAKARDHGEVVRDEEIGEVFVALQIAGAAPGSRRARDVERRHRLVEHDQRRPGGDGAGDGHALALAAGDFVDAPPGKVRVEADALEQCGDCALAARRGRRGRGCAADRRARGPPWRAD